jgi:hypothetical protein
MGRTAVNDQTGNKENDIPILEDIVIPGEPVSPESPDKAPASTAVTQEQYELMDTLMVELKIRLMEELEQAIKTNIANAVDKATANLQQVIKDELYHSLQHQMNQLVNEVLEQYSSPKK